MTKHLLLLALALLMGCSKLETPEINGVVVDAETGKLIEYAHAHVLWLKQSASFGGKGTGAKVKELWLDADQSGQLIIPGYRILNIEPIPITIGQGGCMTMSIYAHEYMHVSYDYCSQRDFEKAKNEEFKDKDSQGRIIYKLRRIADPDTYVKNNSDIYPFIDNKLDYLIKDYLIFIKRFPNDKRCPGFRLGIGTLYEKKGELQKAKKEYENIIKIYPASTAATEAKNRLLGKRGAIVWGN